MKLQRVYTQPCFSNSEILAQDQLNVSLRLHFSFARKCQATQALPNSILCASFFARIKMHCSFETHVLGEIFSTLLCYQHGSETFL